MKNLFIHSPRGLRFGTLRVLSPPKSLEKDAYEEFIHLHGSRKVFRYGGPAWIRLRDSRRVPVEFGGIKEFV